ncbi:MAG: hypothetical protein WCV90_00760 [Candidatus Woesearchaeota archaeon]|jgi:hypothetical protein
MLERILGPKRLVGLALIAYVGIGATGCGGSDSCANYAASNYSQSTLALMGSGESISKEDANSEYGKMVLGLKDDGCREGCYPQSETCCWCPD